MAVYLLKRLLLAVFVVFAVTLLVSFAIRLSGDPATMLMTGGQANFTAEDLDRIRKAIGIDKPFIVQYAHYMRDVLVGDFGKTFFGRQSVSELIGQALPATSIPLGIHAAVRRGSLTDQAIRFVSLIGLSFPNFWLAIMLVLFFSIELHWL